MSPFLFFNLKLYEKRVIKMGIGQSISIENVAKFYGSFQALDNVNLKAEPGEFVTILGSSGSGKTTLLKTIAGFENIDRGSIIINGEDMAQKKAYERNIGMLFQNYALFPHLTVEANIAYPLKLRNYSKADMKKAVADMISLVKLDGLEKRFPKQLSGGQQQRVALARALVYNPPLLLLDEPLGALDKNLRHEMQFEIKRIQRELGITTISVTHDQEEALTMSDKICIMSHGVIQQTSTPEVIYSEPENQFVAEFMGSTNLLKAKVLDKQRDGDYMVSTVLTGLSPEPFVIKELAVNKAGYNLQEVLVAVRPEMIHLMKDRVDKINSFKVDNVANVYLGDSVSMKFKTADGNMLAAKISPESFRKYGSDAQLDLYFNPDGATIIYEKEYGKALQVEY